MFTDNSTGTCKWTSVKNPSRNFRWMLHETVLSLIVAGNSFRCRTETISVSVCRREATGTSLHGVSQENELFEAPGQVSCSCLMKHERFLRILYIPRPLCCQEGKWRFGVKGGHSRCVNFAQGHKTKTTGLNNPAPYYVYVLPHI